MSIDKAHAKKDLMSYPEFTKLARNGVPEPEYDSPGDSAENDMAETLIGMEYDEEFDDPEYVPSKEKRKSA